MKNTNLLEINTLRNIRTRTLDIYLTKVEGDKAFTGKPIEFVEENPDGANVQATIKVPLEDVQRLMDQLWADGVRPSNGEGNIGQIGAIGAHLRDMRAIAFAKLNIEDPKK